MYLFSIFKISFHTFCGPLSISVLGDYMLGAYSLFVQQKSQK